MARNVEIKARITDLATIRANAAALASGPMESGAYIDLLENAAV